MPTEPLSPFAPPAGFPVHLAISPEVFMGWALVIVFIVWACYTLVAIYHWIKYSHAATVAFPAIIVHLFVSMVLITFALSGLILP